MEKFPVGGSRENVFNHLRKHGYQMSNWSDKLWFRADGFTVNIYGAGSMAIVFDKDKNLIADKPIAEAIK